MRRAPALNTDGKLTEFHPSAGHLNGRTKHSAHLSGSHWCLTSRVVDGLFMPHARTRVFQNSERPRCQRRRMQRGTPWIVFERSSDHGMKFKGSRREEETR